MKKTEAAKRMQERADALAHSLIECFGYTNGQLICQLTIAAIGQKIIDDKLDGKYEPPDEADLAANAQPIEVALGSPLSIATAKVDKIEAERARRKQRVHEQSIKYAPRRKQLTNEQASGRP